MTPTTSRGRDLVSDAPLADEAAAPPIYAQLVAELGDPFAEGASGE